MRYYDRRGNALPNINAVDWSDDARRVAFTTLPGGVEVSTVHLGIDHSFGHGPPLIFETMIFGGTLDQDTQRYPTEAEAKAGHAEMVERARQAVTP